MKLIVFDVDGTLLTLGEREILDSTKETLLKLKENGYTLAVASGRCYEIIDPRLVALDVFDYYICSRGATICENGVLEEISTIDEETVQALLRKTKEIDGSMSVYYKQGIEILYGYPDMVDLYDKFVGESVREYYFNIPYVGEKANGDLWIEHEDIEEWRKEFPHLNFNWNRYKCFYEYTPKEQSKAAAIEVLRNRLQIEVEDIIAFGDSDNDIEMLKYAGYAVAMGNATEEVKAVSDYITSNVNEDGIYNACKYLKFI